MSFQTVCGTIEARGTFGERETDVMQVRQEILTMGKVCIEDFKYLRRYLSPLEFSVSSNQKGKFQIFNAVRLYVGSPRSFACNAHKIMPVVPGDFIV